MSLLIDLFNKTIQCRWIEIKIDWIIPANYLLLLDDILIIYNYGDHA